MDGKPSCFDILTTPNAVRIRFGQWPPASTALRGTVVLLGGRSEFMEKYAETIAELNQRGFMVYSFDWRGQGLSTRLLPDRHKGHIESFDQYLQDMQLIVEQVVKPNQHDPLILLAHSMGGHLALRYVHDHPGIFDKVVLTAPLLDVHLAPALKCFIHGLAQMVAGCGGGHLYAIGSGSRNALAPNRFRGNRLTSDRLRFDRNRSLLAAQPELGVNGVTYAWLKAAFDSIAILNARSYIQAITLPVLMVTAGQDTIVSRSAQLAFCDALPDCEERTISGARHEILMEADPYRAIFWETFDQFAYR